jgi:hypothetical protein
MMAGRHEDVSTSARSLSPMPSPPKGPKRPASTSTGAPSKASQVPAPATSTRRGVPLDGIPPVVSAPSASGDVSLGVAVSADAGSGTVTARKAGGLRDMAMDVDPDTVGVKAALQHLAKAVNIAFQSDYGENYLEAVYQAAIVRKGEIHIIHREYFGLPETWFGQLGMLIRSMQLTLDGPDPASPEGQKRIVEKGPSTIRGLFNLLGRKLDLVAEFEDRVPAYVEQMFDRLEGSGIIVGWDRDDWEISTTTIGLNIRIIPKPKDEGMVEVLK